MLKYVIMQHGSGSSSKSASDMSRSDSGSSEVGKEEEGGNKHWTPHTGERKNVNLKPIEIT